MSETEDYDKSATPTAHKTTHQDGGSDEISATGLSGLLADDQHVLDTEVLAIAATLAHKTRHEDTGADEISVTALSGVLADDQHIIDAEAVSAMGTKANSNPLNHDRYADSEALAAAVQTGAITNSVTKAPTHDAVYDLLLALFDHADRHQNEGEDEMSVAGLSGLLADDQHVLDTEVVAAAQTVKLDDFTAPDDNTDLDASISKHGLIPKTDKVKLDGIANSAARAYRAATQTVAAGVATKLGYDTEDYDTGNNFDPTTNFRYTVPTGQAGKYLIQARAYMASPTADYWYSISIYKNGTIVAGTTFQFPTVVSGSLFMNEILNLAATDYIEVYLYFADEQEVGGGSEYTAISFHRLS